MGVVPIFHSVQPERHTAMKKFVLVAARVMFLVTLATISSAAVVVPVARASTGAPNVGNFVSGTYSCTTQNGPTPAVRVSGKWAVRDAAFFVIATPWGWPQVDPSSLQIRVNNVLVNNQSDPARANIATIPAWDGVPGHEPILGVTVSNPPPAQPFHFLMQWKNWDGKGSPLGLLSIGAAGWDGPCSDTTNPPPR